MPKPPRVYQRLTRASAGVATYSSLWLAADHLLIVSSTGYTENYSRVMLRDIKALFITGSDRRLWWALVWGLLALIAGIRVVMLLMMHDPPIGSAIFLAIGAVGLTWNYGLGAGCRVHVMTGVQTARLPGLVRIKKTRRVIAQLRPAIATAQADLAVAPEGQAVPLRADGAGAGQENADRAALADAEGAQASGGAGDATSPSGAPKT